MNSDVETSGFMEHRTTPESLTLPEQNESRLEQGEYVPRIACFILKAGSEKKHGDPKSDMKRRNTLHLASVD